MTSAVRLVVASLLLAACASGSRPSGPGETRGAVPDLRGRRVLVLPVQLRNGVPSDLTFDEETEYALRNRSEQVSWAFPSDVAEILRRSPTVQADPHNLPVGIFLQAEVNRIGDPLYGEVRRLATLAGATVVIIPIQLRYGADGAYHLLTTLLNPVTGRVLWLATIDGEPGPPESPVTLATLADAYSRALVPLG